MTNQPHDNFLQFRVTFAFSFWGEGFANEGHASGANIQVRSCASILFFLNPSMFFSITWNQEKKNPKLSDNYAQV